jgi:hypothetical protein
MGYHDDKLRKLLEEIRDFGSADQCRSTGCIGECDCYAATALLAEQALDELDAIESIQWENGAGDDA